MTDRLRPPAARWDDGMQLRVLVDAAASDGRMALCELTAPAGTATRVHVHAHEDEVVHVVRGAFDVWTRSEHRVLGAGNSIVLPRGVPHRLAAAPTPGRADAEAEALLVFLPGGVEATLLAASSDDPADEPLSADDLAALLAGAGVRLLPWERPPLLKA